MSTSLSGCNQSCVELSPVRSGCREHTAAERVSADPDSYSNGPYTIAVDTVSSCGLNPALQHRSYAALLTTTGTMIDVALTEPRFRVDSNGRGNRFSGRVVGGGVTFTLDYSTGVWFDQHPNLVEQLDDNTYLVLEGNASVTGTAAGLTGTFKGNLSHWDSRFRIHDYFPFNGILGDCSDTFQFRVTPR